MGRKCKSCGSKKTRKGRLLINEAPIYFDSGGLKDPRVTAIACQSCGHVELLIPLKEWKRSVETSLEMSFEEYIANQLRNIPRKKREDGEGITIDLEDLAELVGVSPVILEEILKEKYAGEGIRKDLRYFENTLFRYNEEDQILEITPPRLPPVPFRL